MLGWVQLHDKLREDIRRITGNHGTDARATDCLIQYLLLSWSGLYRKSQAILEERGRKVKFKTDKKPESRSPSPMKGRYWEGRSKGKPKAWIPLRRRPAASHQTLSLPGPSL